MFQMKTISTLMITFLISAIAAASGSGGGGDYGGYSSRPIKRVDHSYEYGKSIYNGREKGVAKLNYCLLDAEDKTKIKRSVIQNFKNTSYTELANNLYNCDVPEDLVVKSLDTKQLSYVIYYLNKRYKLNLAKK